MTVEVRQATPDDIDGLVASSSALFAEDGATRDRLRNPDWPTEQGAGWCADMMADPTALVIVAADGTDVIGHLVGTFAEASEMWRAPRAELVSMFVAAPWRGAGIGSRLVAYFLDWARDRGAARVQVDAYAANGGALRFYKRHGFAPLSENLAADL
jgi:GNAT superfamily N-acetyltransferase